MSAAFALGAGVSMLAATPPDWQTVAGGRVAAVSLAVKGSTGFATLNSRDTGLRFTNRLSQATMARNSTLLGGSGVALGDVDGDGWCDVYLCGLECPNVLYRNLGGFRFADITSAAGVACDGVLSRGATFADVDGDGDLDLLVTINGGGTRVFANDGKGVFREITAQAGTGAATGSTSLALADVDGDGDLDLYVANFGVNMVLRDGGAISFRMVNGRPTVMGRHANRIKVIDGRLVELGEPDVLYLNDGAGRFRALPWDAGAFLDEDGKPAATPWDFGLAVQIRDLNGDHRPDIYLCNDFQTPDRVWINQGGGRFRAIDRLAMRKLANSAMGVDCADVDRDGFLDVLVVEMLSRDPARRLTESTPDQPGPPSAGVPEDRSFVGRNVLLHNRGDGTYAERAWQAGLAATDWSWMPAFVDMDLDGYEDVLVVNGHPYDLMDLDTTTGQHLEDARRAGIKPYDFPPMATPNCAFRNRGDLTFEDRSAGWGFDSQADSNGMALGDLDNDGDLDAVLNCLNGPAQVLRNEATAPRVLVRLRGQAPNTAGIGGFLTVRAPDLPVQTQEMIAGGRYQSADEPARMFAAGNVSNRLDIEVRWPSGRHSRLLKVPANRLIEVDEAAASVPASAPPVPVDTPWFVDVGDHLNHQHRDLPFEDLDRQPLLPRRLSQLGPAVAWFDLDGDGRDELFIGAGSGGALGAFRILDDGRFAAMPLELPPAWHGVEMAGLAGITLSPGRQALLAAVSSYETTNRLAVAAWVIEPSTNLAALALTGILTNGVPASPGPLTVADLDGDSDLDLFVGGRVVPGAYPLPGGGGLWRNESGQFRRDETCQPLFQQLGMVSGATFSDLTGDGWPELVLACDWGPLKLFRNDAGRLAAWDPPVEMISPRAPRPTLLSQWTGWWQSVTTADVDGDGRLDLIAGNWGRNSAWQPAPGRPLRLLYGDFDDDGVTDMLDCEWAPASGQWLARAGLNRLRAALPLLAESLPTHAAFSRTDVDAILGDQRRTARELQAVTLASGVFFNRGDHFEWGELPSEAQLAPVFGLCAADFDGDGAQDLFLAQNFFGLPEPARRLDAGRGLLLRGDGRGGWASVPGQVSGIVLHGEQRGSAVSDFDGDGRPDLVVSQNGATTAVLRNVTGRPGLRVRMKGPPGNPQGTGTVVRLKAGDWTGPACEVRSGSGYWSQDSAVLVLGSPTTPTRVWARLPGGKTLEMAVPSEAREVILNGDETKPTRAD